MSSPRHTDFRVLKIHLLPKHYDLGMGLLFQAGLSCAEEKRHRKTLELTVQVPAKFRVASLLSRIRLLEKSYFPPNIFLRLKSKTVARGSWEKKYQRYLQPFVLLKNLPGKNVPLQIDPRGKPPGIRDSNTLSILASLAFGTGTHATTQLSAEYLAQALSKHPSGRVLDMGCGTAILAMTARKVGAKRVVAVDNDPIALEMARENLRLNRIRGVLLKTDLGGKGEKFDVIVANIGLNTLLELRELLLKHLAPGGDLILSGLLYRDFKEIRRGYRAMKFIQRKNKTGWTALWLKRGI